MLGNSFFISSTILTRTPCTCVQCAVSGGDRRPGVLPQGDTAQHATHSVNTCRVHIHTRTHMHTHTHIHMRMCKHMHTSAHTYTCARTHTHSHTCRHTKHATHTCAMQTESTLSYSKNSSLSCCVQFLPTGQRLISPFLNSIKVPLWAGPEKVTL